MKLSSGIPKITMAGLVSGLFIFLSVSAAHAQFLLLTVDDSNPSAVVITATEAAPSATVSNVAIPEGIDLLNFFSDNVTPSSPPDFSPANSTPTPTLTTGATATGLTFTEFSSDNSSLDVDNGVKNIDLNLLNNADSLTDYISFDTSKPALVGALTLNLNGVSGLLPTVGSGGDIITGFSGSASNTVVGEWEAVPEPSSWELTLIVLGVSVVLHRRSRLRI